MYSTIDISSTVTRVRELGTSISVLNTRKKTLNHYLTGTIADIEDTENAIQKNDEMQVLLSQSIQILYEGLSSKLGDIITEGIKCVFPDSPYTKFVIDFVPRRDSIEADLYLIDKDGEKYHPMDAVGGGVADLIAMVLRITYIKLSKSRDILIADEPLKFVDRSRIEDAAAFIQKVCKDLDFSLLLITHIPEMIQVADAVYKVLRKSGVSSVTRVH